ncbi:MAG: GNAT family N-acetyltransferase [Proteobacteria bacterium]|nr:GNAT family N-acetyltransferase [Pseudomonadota bacterium]
MDTVTVRPCLYAELEGQPNFVELVAEYARESSIVELPEHKPHSEMYRAMEHVGVMQVLCAFQGDVVVGFAILLVTVLPHYSVPAATMESLFVGAAYRHSGAGFKLLRAAEEVARAKGAVGLLVSAPKGGQLAEVLTRMRSYRETNRVFFRGLSC